MLLHPSSVVCAMCRTPLDVLRAREARTCRTPACVQGYERLPAQCKCRYCGDQVALESTSPGLCSAPPCRALRAQESIRHARAELIRLTLQVRAERDTAAANAGHGTAPVPAAAAMVPRNTALMRKTAARRHKALETLMRELLRTMRRTVAADDRAAWFQPDPLPMPVAQVIAATCTACRGHCCRGGRDHAFLKVETMRAYAEAHPELDDDAIVQAYLSYLPARAMHPGCVYQGRRGCTLPRTMRSAICNKFLCTGLHDAIDDGITDATRGVYVAHRTGNEVHGGRLRTLPVLP